MDSILPQLLGAPFLTFTGVIIFIVLFYTPLKELLGKGNINISWGKATFTITDLPDQLDENFAPLQDDVSMLKDKIAQLEEIIASGVQPPPAGDDATEGGNSKPLQHPLTNLPNFLSDEQIDNAKTALVRALETGTYTWRSIERLANKALISTEQAKDILRGMPEVDISISKTGRTIAKLNSSR